MNLIKTIIYTWLASKAVPGGADKPGNRGRSNRGCCGLIAFAVGVVALLIVAWAVTSGG